MLATRKSLIELEQFPFPNQLKPDRLDSWAIVFSALRRTLFLIALCATRHMSVCCFLGLIVVNAWYGHLVSMGESSQDARRGPSKVIGITVQVKDSRLFLTESSKSDLSGFYDPCCNEEKMLQIRYLFREAVHEVTVGDNEAV
ncbi:unnamed protein product [Porites evermanni]|uniref:DnaJ-like protein C11 C-terminal domain-containing protein n=1 Tax=Porites evermanni TaxID=104178 RepID=A0ABN8PJX6_9CNID|nr:unnamed protein product [Porites evermanni]